MRHLWPATLAVLVGCVLFVQWQQYLATRSVASALDLRLGVRNGQMTTNWRWLDPADQQVKTKSVTTTYEAPESDAEWRARHFQEVTDMQAVYPPYHG